MKKQRHIGRSRGVSRLHAHLVLTVKYRKIVISQEMLNRLIEVMDDLCSKWQCQMINCNGEGEHIHVVFRFYPQIELDKFVGNIKSVSSRRMKQEFGEQLKGVWLDGGFWNDSYSIDSVGFTKLDVLERYVQNQRGGL
jgi:putative transposase